MNVESPARKLDRREVLKRMAVVGGAGIAGAALMGGIDRALAASPSNSVGYINQWDQMASAAVIVWADSSGNYYVKDNGIGSHVGDLIVNASLITSYGNSLGAGTAGASTTTGGIQEAINAVGTSGGGLIYLKNNSFASGFLLTSGITDGGFNGITIRGDGFTSLLTCGASFGADMISINKANWVIDSISLNGTNQQGGFHGIRLGTSSNNCTIQNCYVTATGWYGMIIQGTEHLIRGNFVSATGHDNIVLNGSNLACTGNQCEDPVLDNNIALVTCTDVLVSGNILINAPNTGSGVGLENQGSGPCVRCAISNNIIVTPAANGVGYSGVSTPYANQCLVSNNVIDTPTSNGINVLQTSGSIIEGNYIFSSAGNGITCGTNVLETEINLNFLDSPATYGILISGTGITDIQVIGNRVLNNAANNGIHLGTVTRFIISENRYHRTLASKTGVGIETSASIDGTIIGNNIVGNADGGEGILVSAGTDIICIGNYVDGYAVGIDEIGASDFNIYSGNDVRNNNTSKILTVGTHTRVRDNIGFNPENKVTNPFNSTTFRLGVGGNAAVPVASQDYLVGPSDIFITAANSSNANNAIVVKDGAGNTVSSPGATMAALYVPAGYVINWGAFTGTAGAVTVWGV